MTKPIEHVGFFFESRIPVYLLGGHYYLDSWECSEFKHGTGYGVVPGSGCTLRPVYAWQADGIDLDLLDESSADFEDAIQIVGFDIV